jgi:hypothetical protein
MQLIELKWRCLENLFDKDPVAWPDDLLGPQGVYLWTIKTETGYLILYVGKPSELKSRLVQEKKEIEKGQSVLVEFDRFSEMLTSKYIPTYHDPQRHDLSRLVEEMKKLIVVFVATVPDDFDPAMIEGALQIFLLSRSDTRRYLLTGPSSYALRGVTIQNNFGDAIFRGLHAEITTPVMR